MADKPDWLLKHIDALGEPGAWAVKIGEASRSDTWFAWHPVRLGALGTGRLVWLQRVWRNRCMGVTIYQSSRKIMSTARGRDFAKVANKQLEDTHARR